MEPVFGGFWIGGVEAVGELSGAAFYLSKFTFDSVPISAGDVLKSEAESVAGGVEPGRSIDEERGIVDLMFLPEFLQEHPGSHNGSRRKQSDMKEVVGVGINRGEQPELFVINTNHCFIHGDVIRIGARRWL